MNFADAEDWDLDLIHDLVRKEEEAIAAKRDSQVGHPSFPASALSLQPLLRVGHAPVSSLRRAATKDVPTFAQSEVAFVQKAPPVGIEDIVSLSSWKNSFPEVVDHQEQFPLSEQTAHIAQVQKYLNYSSSGTQNFLQGRTPNARNVDIPVQGRTGEPMLKVPQPHNSSRYHHDHDSIMEGPCKENLDASRHNSTSQTLSAGRSLLPLKVPEAHGIQGQSMGHDHSSTAQPGGVGKPEALLVEKENLIYELRTRLFQADQELSQLRQKAMPHTGALSSTLPQKEIERLKAQVLFKDQELLEARRACAHKSEQLKRIVNEVDYLRKESGEVKKIRQLMASSDLKHMEETRIDNVHGSGDTFISEAAINPGLQNQDHWLPPWTIGGTSQGAPKVGASVAQNTSLDREDSLVVAELKARTFDNGSTSNTEEESRLGSGFLQAPEMLPKDALMPSNGVWGSNNRGGKISLSTLGREVEKRIVEQSPKCSKKLLKIWSSGNVKRDCSELISKLFAVCQADMHVLLSIGLDKAGCSRKSVSDVPAGHLLTRNRENEITDKKVASDLNEDSKEVNLGSSGALELHFIIAKMANGLASSWTLFMAVVELCKLESVQVVESALRVLHCILIHDCNCRSELFGRSSFQSPQKKEAWKLSPLFSPVPEALQLKDLLDAQSNLRVVEDRFSAAPPMQMLRSHFCSPRVYCQIGGSEVCQVKEHDILHNREKCRPMGMQEVNAFQGKQGKSFLFGKGMQDTWAKELFGWIFPIALKGASQAIRVEAMAILNVLVMDTEPMIQREHFGSIMFDGSISSLLRKYAGLDVQLQAVRLVHIILHCPHVLERLCASEETAHDFATVSGQVLEGDICIQDGVDAGNTEGESDGKEFRTQVEASKYSRKAELDSKVEVLEGLISCLYYNSGSLQEYSLRRSALRVLAFIATSGHKGAATLLATKVTFSKKGSIKEANKERIKDEDLSTVIAGSLPVHLISLLDKELRTEEEDECSLMRMVEREERDRLIREALTLLCRLASHPTQSAVTLAAVTVNDGLTRLSICITNRLISRGSLCEISKPEDTSAVSASDMVDLARGLRRRILGSVCNP